MTPPPPPAAAPDDLEGDIEQDQLIWLIRRIEGNTFWLGLSDTVQRDDEYGEKVLYTAVQHPNGERQSAMYILTRENAQAVAAALLAPWKEPGNGDQ